MGRLFVFFLSLVAFVYCMERIDFLYVNPFLFRLLLLKSKKIQLFFCVRVYLDVCKKEREPYKDMGRKKKKKKLNKFFAATFIAFQLITLIYIRSKTLSRPDNVKAPVLKCA